MTAPVLSLPVKVLRSATAGRRPGDGTFRALTDGELFVNTQDRVACMLDASGNLFAFPIDPNVLATQAFVTGNFGAASPSMAGTAATGSATTAARSDHVHPTDTTRAAVGNMTPAMDGTAAAGSAATAARSDHVHPTDTSRAPLASPAFTGTPTAPTQAAGDGSTNLATTAYADRAASNAQMVAVNNAPVKSVAGRTGTVTLAVADVSGAAPLASPALTGSPTAPTAAAADNSTKLATTAYADGAVATEKTRATTAEGLLAPKASPAFTGTASFAARPTFNGATPYDSANLTQAAVNGLIGYVPARPSTSFGGSVSGQFSTGTGSSYTRGTYVQYTATAANLLAVATVYVANNNSSAVSAFAGYLRAVDTTTNQVVATGAIALNQAPAGGGCELTVPFEVSGLTPGDTINIELWTTTTGGTAGTGQNISLGGLNA